MDEFEQNDLEKETNDCYSTCYQNEIRYKQKENAFIKKCKCVLSSPTFITKLGLSMTEIFSVGQKDDNGIRPN